MNVTIPVDNDVTRHLFGLFFIPLQVHRRCLQANELSTYICQKRDLGCKLSSLPDIIPEEKQHFGAGQTFWELLGGQEDYQGWLPFIIVILIRILI